MKQNKARTDEEYNKLQKNVLDKINKTNAAELSVRSKKRIIEHLKKIDVNNIRDVEDFYLLALEFITSNKYVLAQIDSQQKGSKLETELMKQGPDALLPFLISQFKTDLSQHCFSKIIEIECLHKPGLQEWAQVHINFLALTKGLYEEPKTIKLTQLLEKETSRLKKEAFFFEKSKVNQFIEQVEKITLSYLIHKNEDKFLNEMTSHINKTREQFKDKPKWQKIFDTLANALIQLFKQSQAHNEFSFFANPATQENINHLEVAVRPK